MKIVVILIGLIVVLLGLLPLIIEQELLPTFLGFLPETSVFYQIAGIVLGLLTMYYGFKTD